MFYQQGRFTWNCHMLRAWTYKALLTESEFFWPWLIDVVFMFLWVMEKASDHFFFVLFCFLCYNLRNLASRTLFTLQVFMQELSEMFSQSIVFLPVFWWNLHLECSGIREMEPVLICVIPCIFSYDCNHSNHCKCPIGKNL